MSEDSDEPFAQTRGFAFVEEIAFRAFKRFAGFELEGDE